MRYGTPVRLVLALALCGLAPLVAAVPPAVWASAAPTGSTARVAGHLALLKAQAPADLILMAAHILREAEEARYTVRREGDGYGATNLTQGLRVTFTAGGPQLSALQPGGWRWGLRLTAYGRGHLQPTVMGLQVADGSSLTYQRNGLTEWYINTPRGLEQGFTVQQRPAGSPGQPVRLALLVSGNLRARPVAGGQVVDFVGPAGAVMLRYDGLRAVDARGRIMASHLAVTGRTLWLVVDDRAGVYPLRIDPFAQHQELNASDGNANDQLGSAIKLSSDGNTALVGALGAGTAAGAAYIFTRKGDVWTQQQKLTAKDGAPNDNFGVTLALSSDGNTALIGANGKNNATGAAYIFTRKGATWSQQQKLTAKDGAAGDQFGSVGLSADGTAAVVGASQKNSFAGAAYVFTSKGGTWTQAQKLMPSDTIHDLQFGTAAALSSDGSTVIIGQDNRVTHTGAAYVFTRKGPTWVQQQRVVAPDTTTNDEFGNVVTLSGDGNTALIGSSSKNNSIGSVRVFTRKGTAWTSLQELTPGDGEANDAFGILTTLSSDGSTALIGAYNKVNSTGAAYVFTRTGAKWSQQQELTGSDSQPGDTFGYQGGLNGNGDTILVSAVGHNSYQGTVYYFGPGVAPTAHTGPTATPFSGALSGGGSTPGTAAPTAVSSQPSTTSSGPDGVVYALIGVAVLVLLGLLRIVLSLRRRRP